MSINHNLQIQNYNFQELLDLFELNVDMKLEDLKRAKRKVLYLHPDKSKLPPQYFLFYKKAFEIIVGFFEEKTKQEREIPNTETPIKYKPVINDTNDDEIQKVAKTIQQYQSQNGDTKFNQKFNELFDQNMSRPIDTTRNEWFQSDKPTYAYDQPVTQQNMGQALNTIKTQAAKQQLAKYKGVDNIYSNVYGLGTCFHDDSEDNGDSYIAADLFSKLKFDDLRRVHKDQTVFLVSEQDYDPNSRAKSLDHLSRERNTQDLTPIEKSYAESILEQQQKEYERQMYQKQHNSRLRTMEYEEKNRDVMANFLRLTK